MSIRRHDSAEMKGRPLETPNGIEAEEDDFVGFQRHGMAVLGRPAAAAPAPVLGSSPTAPVNLSTLAEAAEGEPASSSASSNNKNSAASSSRSRYRGRFSEVRNPGTSAQINFS